MTDVCLAAIVAVSENGMIGRDNGLPWHLPEDLRYFKRVTLGKPVVMGRKTWDSIGKPLPGRSNIVLSGDPAFHAEGAQVVANLDEGLALAASIARAEGSDEVMVVGGAALYAEAMPRLQRLYLTRVHAEVEGDTVLTGFDLAQWREVSRHFHAADENNRYDCSFIVYEKP